VKNRCDVAIVGMACNLPKAKNYSEFWDVLKNRVDAIEEITGDRWNVEDFYSKDFESRNKSVSKWAGMINDADKFDNHFFNISPREAKSLDPQQRKLLEETMSCIEDSGVPLKELQQKNTGVYIGALTQDYLQETLNDQVDIDAYSTLGNYSCMMSNRISYMFNLKGNSQTIEAACVSGLVALHQAKNAIQLGECEYAIVGAANMNLNPWKYVSYGKARMLSEEGRCKTFAQDADGFVSGDGAVVFLMQSVESAKRDGNHIYVVVKGSCVNHVGKGISLTAPSVEGQKKVALVAYEDAGFSPETVSFVECHGTGTTLGDPMELEAMTQAFREYTDKRGFCKIGSVKTNIGHLEAASGLASLIKIVLMMKYGKIVPNLHCDNLNIMLELEKTPFVIANSLENWQKEEGDTYRAGINCFGFGGVNAHILLESYKMPKLSKPKEKKFAFMLSAKSKESLLLIIEKWKRLAETEEFVSLPLSNICKTLAVGRESFPLRVGTVVKTNDELQEWLNGVTEDSICHVNKGSYYLQVDDEMIAKAEQFFKDKQNEKWIQQQQEKIKLIVPDVSLQQILLRGLTKGIVEENYRSAFEFYVVNRYLDWLFEMKLNPDFISSNGNGVLNSLVASGILEERDLYDVFTGKRSKEDLIWSRPVIPYYDSKNGKMIMTFQFSKGYFEHLYNSMIQEIKKLQVENIVNIYFGKALVLIENQHSFKKMFKEWEIAFEQKGYSLISMLKQQYELGSKNDNETLLLFIAVCSTIQKLRKKFSLNKEISFEAPALSEAVLLTEEKYIEKEDWILFLISANNKDSAEFLEKMANERITLLSRIDEFNELQNYNRELTELGDKVAWFDSINEELNLDVKGFSKVEVMDDSLETLLNLWLHYQNIPWDKFYEIGKFQKIPLPTYSFTGKSFWVYDKKIKSSNVYDYSINNQILKEGVENMSKDNMEEQSHKMLKLDMMKYLKEIWAKRLCVDENTIGENDSFFDDLGLDSMGCIEIISILEKDFKDLSTTVLFEFPTLTLLVEYLMKNYPKEVSEKFAYEDFNKETQSEKKDKEIVNNEDWINCNQQTLQSEEIQIQKEFSNEIKCDEIAIVGLSGRYPKSKNVKELWKHLLNGESLTTEVTKDRWDSSIYYSENGKSPNKSYTKWGGYMEDYDKFDTYFFKIPPRQAKLMDPQQRVFLETAYEAIEDAGYTKDELPRNTGLYVGATTNTYAMFATEEASKDNMQCVDTDIYDIANRVSYFLDLTGPSMTIDSACSSSLTALHLAVQSIKNNDCEAAIVGGVSLTLHPQRIIQFCQKNMLIKGKDCHPFGAGDGGFVDSEGAGAILIKPLLKAIEDGDHIYAVLKSTSINAGGRTSGYTVPNPKAQADLIRKAIKRANISPRTIQYVEAHGTGTSLGDPIEIKGLTEAYEEHTDEKQFCAIGSIKSNIGHTIATAGIAGLTKVLLQMKYKMLVPSLNSEELNSFIPFEQTPFYVQHEVSRWENLTINGKKLPRRASVSAFGAGGANAHVILEEYVKEQTVKDNKEEKDIIFVLSANNQKILKQYAKRYIEFLKDIGESNYEPDFQLENLAFTLQTGREVMDERIAFVVKNKKEIIERLESFCNDDNREENYYTGNKKEWAKFNILLDGIEGKQYFETLIRENKLNKIAKLWAMGAFIPWKTLYAYRIDTLRKISLPTYPFERLHFWIDTVEKKNEIPEVEKQLATERHVKLPKMIYELEWKKTNKIKHFQNSQYANFDETLIFYTRLDSILKEWVEMECNKSYSSNIHLVSGNRNLINNNNGDQQISINDAEAIDTLIQRKKRLKNVFFIMESVDEISEDVVYTMFHIIKSIIQWKNESDNIEICIITRNNYKVLDDDMVNPFGASLHGFIAALKKEYNLWNFKYIDIDETSSKNRAIFHDCLLEKEYWENKSLLIIRDGSPYERYLAETDLQSLTNEKYSFKNNGTYIIIGGMGGIGYALASYCARYYKVNLVLVGRSLLNRKKEEKIQSLIELGGNALYIQANVENESDMEQVFEKTKSLYGNINGIIHSAMSVNVSLFENMTEEMFRNTLKPKVNGLIVLNKLLQNKKLDFLLVFSSTQSFMNNIKFCDYSAASTFEDSYVLYMQQTLPFAVKLINWGYWDKFGDIAAKHDSKLFQAQGQIGITVEEGMEVINRLLGQDKQHVIAVKGEESFLRRLGVIDELDEDNCKKIQQSKVPYIQEVYRTLNSLCEMQLLQAFRRKNIFIHGGEIYNKEQIKQTLNILLKFNSCFNVLLHFLEKAGYITVQGTNIISSKLIDNIKLKKQLNKLESFEEELFNKYEEIRAHIRESSIVFNHMIEILSGEMLSTECIFPNGSLELIESIYKENKLAEAYGAFVTQHVFSYIEERRAALKAGETIKILEIGAGVGGVSYYLLKALLKENDIVEYSYTDISKTFLKYGINHYSQYSSFTKFEVLNIDSNAIEQGFEKQGYDIIIASNVIHATRNISNTLNNVTDLLKENGLLIMNEVTDMFMFLVPLGAFLDGWWLFEDEKIRVKDAPMLTVKSWDHQLKEKGFVDIKFNRVEDVEEDVWNQHVICAKYAVASKKDNQIQTSNDVSKIEGKERIEKIISNIIIKVLQIDRSHFNYEATFADNGVDSILAGEIIGNINEELSIRLRITSLFSYPTIESLANHIWTNFQNQLQLIHSPKVTETEGETLLTEEGEQEDTMVNDWLKKLVSGDLDIDDVCVLMEDYYDGK